MEVIGKPVLGQFKQAYPEVAKEVDALLAEMEAARWQNPHELLERYPKKASLLKDGHVFFDVRGNRYRLHFRVFYNRQVILIKKYGTHKQYDTWKPE